MKNTSQNVQYQLDSDPTAIEYQLETDQLAQELKKKMGLKPVKKTEKTKNGSETFVDWEITERAWMNSQGIENAVGIARGYADKINQTSQYDSVQIETLMKHMHKALARDIAENWTEYNVGKRGNADNVMEMITGIVWSTFNASLGGKKMELISDSAETVTQSVQKSEEDNNSRFSL